MILYALKSALVLMLLYTCFFALTSRETFHRLNRVLLVGSLVLALVVPLIQIKTNRPTPFPSLEWRGEVTSSIINYIPEEITSSTTEVSTPLPHREGQGVGPMGLLVFGFYFLGFSAIILHTLVQFVSLFRYLRGGLRHTDEFGNTVILHRGQVAPFSVFRFIVMSVEDYESGGAILRHEQAHIRLGHTYDLLLLQVVKAVQWFSPFVWLLDRDLKAVHEYEADEAVINFGIDAKQYQQLLVTKAVGNRLQPFANNLRRGSLKKRIFMMYRKKSSRPTMLKALFVVPVTAITLCAFATPKVQETVEAVSKADPTTAVINRMMAPVAATIGSVESTTETTALTANHQCLESNDNTPATTVFKCADIAKALERLQADENTLYMIDKEVLSREDFMKRAMQMEYKDVSGTGTWSGLGVAAGELGEVAKNYSKAIHICTRDYFMSKKEEVDENYVFSTPEVEAQYPGGEAALLMQLAKTLRYPTYAMNKNITGQVILQFVVEKDGSIGPIKVQKGLEERCDAEAILAVSNLGKFTPAQQQGKPVRSYCTIPVSFRLN